MTDYLTEQEQIELLKNWIKQYSLVILAGVTIAVIAITGWRYWEQRQQKTLTHASNIYDELLIDRAQNDKTATATQAQKLLTHYSQTSYGQMAAFILARQAIVKKDYPAAEKQLTHVLKHSKIPAFRQIARIRLARIKLAEQQAAEALSLLHTIDDKSFAGLINEIKGDAYLAQNKTAEARDAYSQALAEIPNAEVSRPLLQMKYDNLAT